MSCDESVRGGTSPEALAGVPSAFSPGGAVTAGNSSPINDGAVAVPMGTAAAGRRYGLNEAFAAMVLSCLDELDVPEDRVNPHGGAIALGHPVGASAARAVVDCARQLRRRGGGIGLIAACIGVGQGIAMVIES